MTYQSPRIYIYKITFEEVPYYYYGVKKEEYYNQEYWGSPKTNKWCWELYTPKKQILEVFEFSDGGWLEAQEVEKRLIQPVFNTDKWCLNENYSGVVSLECLIRGGKITGNKNKEFGRGFCGITKEERSIISKMNYENGIGLGGMTGEKRIEIGKKGAAKNKKNKVAIFALTKEQLSNQGKKTNSQRWECLETGFITNPGNLTQYQRARGIDTSKRKRIG
jgi:hypothetical protein